MNDKPPNCYVVFSTAKSHSHIAFSPFKYSEPVKLYYKKLLEQILDGKKYPNITEYLYETECMLNTFISDQPDTCPENVCCTDVPKIIQNNIDLGDDPSFLGYYLTGNLSWGVCQPDLRKILAHDNNNKTILIFISVTRESIEEDKKKKTLNKYYYCGYASYAEALSHKEVAFNIESPLIPSYTVGLMTRDSMLLEFSSTIVGLIIGVIVLHVY